MEEVKVSYLEKWILRYGYSDYGVNMWTNELEFGVQMNSYGPLIVKYFKVIDEWLFIEDFRKLSKIENSDGDKFSWLTLSPDHLKRRVEYNGVNIIRLRDFCENIGYLYHDYEYIIEAGKDVNNPHVHVHLLINIKNSKKHKQNLRAKWDQYVGLPICWNDDYDLRQWRKHEDMPTYDSWLGEKLNYMINDRKGTHINFVDLDTVFPGARGGTGVSTDN